MTDIMDEKKDLLQREITDKGYDQNEFLQFCVNKKENGDDINNWTFDELKEVVNEFSAKYSKNTSENLNKDSVNNPQTVSSELNEERLDEINKKIDELDSAKENKETNTLPCVEVRCRKIEKSVLNDKVIVVLIKNPKVETDSKFLFGSTNYTNYEVETPEVGWKVHRRYSEFEWLRTVLVKYHPCMFVPPIPSKKLGGRRFEEDFIEKRMDFLQRFMDEILKSEAFKASEPLTAFLSMNDRTQFELKMRELSTYSPSSYVDQMRTLTGKVKCLKEEVSKANSGIGSEKYFSNVKTYISLQSNIYERLNENLKSCFLNFTALAENLDNIQKDFEILHLINSKVQMREPIKQTFEEFANFFHSWKKILFKQNQCVKLYIKDFFKYAKMENDAFMEIITYRENIRDQFLEENEKLTAKKERLWKTNDISKWEIIDEFHRVDEEMLIKDREYALEKMCTRDTYRVNNIEKQFGYANIANIEELKRLLTINSEKFPNNLKEFGNQFYPTLSDGISMWQKLTTSIN